MIIRRMSMNLVALLAGLMLVPATARAQAVDTGLTNRIDVGVRGTSIDGDGARYERYRDLGDGLFFEGFRLSREQAGWFVDFSGQHVGRKDQRFTGRFVRPGKFKAFVQWDQIPMLMSNSTETLFDGVGTGNLTIGEGWGQYGSNLDLFLANARAVDTKSRRHILDAGFQYLATEELTLNAKVRYTDRDGVIPFGGSFGHSSLVETLAPVSHQTTDVDAGAEMSIDRLLLRAGYTASMFNNDYTTLTFANPFRNTDSATAAASGRLSMPPSSTYYAVNGLASVRLPGRTTISAYGSIGTLKDEGASIMAFTSNSLTVVQPYLRPTVEGEARTTASTLTLTSRPNRMFNVVARYRWYEYDNRTPELAFLQFEPYDGSPSNYTSTDCLDTENAICNETFGVKRQTFDVDFTLTPMRGIAAGVGYTRLEEGRTHRIFDTTAENLYRVVFDSVGTRYFTLRTKYEHSQRRGEAVLGLVEPVNGEDINVLPLEHAGEQFGMRHYDVASRDRDRVTLIGTIMPSDMVVLNASVAAGKDDYIRSEFGLRDNTHRVYTFGVDVMPTDLAVFSGSYSFERYEALSRSRQASNNPAEFDNPARNWATEGLDKVHSFVLMADLTRIADRVDLGFSFDFNKARAFYTYITGPVPDRTLPEETQVDTVLDPPTQLPETLSRLSRVTTDLVFWATERLGIGVSHWFEDYEVQDFTLDVGATDRDRGQDDENPGPDLLSGNTLLLGYLYRPYTANTVWGRIIYRW